jgi:hypothetical protein
MAAGGETLGELARLPLGAPEAERADEKQNPQRFRQTVRREAHSRPRLGVDSAPWR